MGRTGLVLAAALAVVLGGCWPSCDVRARFVESCAKSCGAAGVLLVDTYRDQCICQTGPRRQEATP